MIDLEKINQVIEKIEGWCTPTEGEYLMKAANVVRDNDFGCIVEIGSWKGKSTVWLLAGTGKSKVYAVDHFKGSIEHQIRWGDDLDVYQEFLQNINMAVNELNLTPNLWIHHMSSLEASDKFERDSIGLLYIDGSHDYEDVISDLNAWIPKMKSGGYIIMHDLNWPGPNRAAREIMSRLKIDIYIVPETTFGCFVVP